MLEQGWLFTGWDSTILQGAQSADGYGLPAESLVAVLSAPDSLELIAPGVPFAEWRASEADVPVAPLLPVLVEAVILPQLRTRRSSVRPLLPRVSPAAARLSQLLLADDPKPAAALIRRLYARAGSLGPLCATVIEPVARNLGDLWSSDDCTEAALTMALCQMQELVRQLTLDAHQAAVVGVPVVLVAPAPGEAHALGAALDADLLWQAGWETHREFPASDYALQTMLADSWYDVLDLALSPSLRREDALRLMEETIAGARLASKNPSLAVVVGGRALFEQCEETSSLGADASTASALQVVLTVTRALERSKQVTRGLALRTAL